MGLMRRPERIVSLAKTSCAVSQLTRALAPAKLFDECRKRGFHIRWNGRCGLVGPPRCASIKDFDDIVVTGLGKRSDVPRIYTIDL